MTRRSNRKDHLRLPYHINLPQEIRLLIYHHLFHGMICPPKPYPYWPQTPSKPHRCKELELRKLSVLRVSRPTREEALPIFEENIIVALRHEDQFMWIQRSCRQARTLRTEWLLTSRTIGDGTYARDLCAKLPALRKVECHIHWEYPITCTTFNAVIENLNGRKLEGHSKILENEIRRTPIRLKNFPCDLHVFMTFEILYERAGYHASKISWNIGIVMDPRSRRIIDRRIDMGSGRKKYIENDGDEISEWVPAREVLFVNDPSLEHPVLFHPRTGKRLFLPPASAHPVAREKAFAAIEKIKKDKAFWARQLVEGVPCDWTLRARKKQEVLMSTLC